MLQFLLAIPEIVLYGCGVLIAVAFAMSVALFWKTWRVGLHMRALTSALRAFGDVVSSQRHDGLSLAALDEIRSQCEKLGDAPREWWKAIDSHIERYTSPEDVEGWLLTEKPHQVLPYEIVIGRNFNAAIFGAFPGLLTGAGLTLTFVAILLALYGVHYDKANTVDPISGIDTLINGLSGKFLSSIVALLLSILFTLYEKSRVRGLRNRYEQMIAGVSEAVPFLSQSRVLLDIQRFAAKQTVSVSHISSEVVDRLVGAFNAEVVPALADGMSSGVAEKMQSEFRPTMQRMNDTLEGLKSAIVRLESQKQESVTGEIRALMTSLEESLVGALSKMGADFHTALTGAASQEFGNVQGTLEATRQMLSDMNTQFGAMQAAFSTIIEKAEQSTSDQMKSGREQTEALTALMNGLMMRMQESADQNLGNVRTQLTLVVSDLAERVGSLSQDMMAAADKVAKQAQTSANQVLDQTGEWSEATAKRLEGLLANMEARSKDFQTAGQSLLTARDFLKDVISQNAGALDRMADASRQVQAYSTGLAGQSDALKGISQLQSQVTAQLRDASGSLRASSEQNEKLLAEYRRTFDGYKSVIDELDQSLGRVLGAIQSGLRDYNQSIENNFKEIVKISNPMISEAASFLQTQIAELSGQLEELSTVISASMERVNGRTK
jgi:ABC-type transporter Mla subunit MlaD